MAAVALRDVAAWGGAAAATSSGPDRSVAGPAMVAIGVGSPELAYREGEYSVTEEEGGELPPAWLTTNRLPAASKTNPEGLSSLLAGPDRVTLGASLHVRGFTVQPVRGRGHPVIAFWVPAPKLDTNKVAPRTATGASLQVGGCRRTR